MNDEKIKFDFEGKAVEASRHDAEYFMWGTYASGTLKELNPATFEKITALVADKQAALKKEQEELAALKAAKFLEEAEALVAKMVTEAAPLAKGFTVKQGGTADRMQILIIRGDEKDQLYKAINYRNAAGYSTWGYHRNQNSKADMRYCIQLSSNDERRYKTLDKAVAKAVEAIKSDEAARESGKKAKALTANTVAEATKALPGLAVKEDHEWHSGYGSRGGYTENFIAARVVDARDSDVLLAKVERHYETKVLMTRSVKISKWLSFDQLQRIAAIVKEAE